MTGHDTRENLREWLNESWGLRVSHIERRALMEQGEHTSACVVLPVSPIGTARELAIAGGEKPEDLHLTIAFLGKAADFSEEAFTQLRGWLESYAKGCSPVHAKISGFGRFTPGGDTDAIYASVDAPGEGGMANLASIQALTVQELLHRGFVRRLDHGFTPHITLKYVKSDEATPIAKVPLLPLTFSSMELWAKGQRWEFPFGDVNFPR